mmetsp:Transcript_106960/g.310570  ORF Transcript_106960/g.310570 Transcript_106960/m.310570 type:complete len:241 (+) Transcript_106960:109-831(+)
MEIARAPSLERGPRRHALDVRHGASCVRCGAPPGAQTRVARGRADLELRAPPGSLECHDLGLEVLDGGLEVLAEQGRLLTILHGLRNPGEAVLLVQEEDDAGNEVGKEDHNNPAKGLVGGLALEEGRDAEEHARHEHEHEDDVVEREGVPGAGVEAELAREDERYVLHLELRSVLLLVRERDRPHVVPALKAHHAAALRATRARARLGHRDREAEPDDNAEDVEGKVADGDLDRLNLGRD